MIMASHPYRNHCNVCGNLLKKNGKTSTGKTRYRCKGCGASSTATRSGTLHQRQMKDFITWLLGPTSRYNNDISRAQRRSMSWCWQVPVPQPEMLDNAYILVLDKGASFRPEHLLVAYNSSHVLGWKWVDKDNKTACMQVHDHFPQPSAAVIDGSQSTAQTIQSIWPGIPVRRCLSHIRKSVDQKTSQTPRTQPAIEIKELTDSLKNVYTSEQAKLWLARYARWEDRWKELLKHRTNVSKDNCSIDDYEWEWTHKELRTIRFMYRKLIKKEELFFPFSGSDIVAHNVFLSRRDSQLGETISTDITNLFSAHRGINHDHGCRMVEWYLNSKTESPFIPERIISHDHWR
ncbi:transposase [Corynebacterium pseudotuberculosis]|nr:transposase [Corynebacterium pseudotuberculosis]ANH22815.1 Insertion element protein [Corynebacterium pseudotuberculosis]